MILVGVVTERGRDGWQRVLPAVLFSMRRRVSESVLSRAEV